LLRLDGEEDLVDGAENLVDLANLGLVFEEDVGVEVRDFGVGRLVHHVPLAGVLEDADFYKLVSLFPWLRKELVGGHLGRGVDLCLGEGGGVHL
jgi:hypothetical protein